MTQQGMMADNGCSLEDCHTNLFALTDLTGIKWRKLSAQAEGCYGDPLDDPVLVSFSRCIQADILCVWRRQPKVATNRHSYQSHHQFPKELWLFWYGEEPEALHNLISSDLNEVESGSWDNGLPYECRTLLFKALHNLMERCLLAQNFIRVGKWFVQPYNGHHSSLPIDKSTNLSISFLFFLHGESTVCASIDVRQHPPLFTLQPGHLAVASQRSHGVHVLLAPYSLAGALTGRSYLESDQKTQKLLEDWRRFFFVPKTNDVVGATGMACGDDTNSGGNNQTPAAVEVIVAGVRLRYPSSFVLVAGDTEVELLKQHSNILSSSPNSLHGVGDVGGSPAAAESSAQRAAEFVSYLKGVLEHREDAESVGRGKLPMQKVIEKVWQDSTVTSGLTHYGRAHHQQPATQEQEGRDDASFTSSLIWDFGEPMQKNPCNCSRTKLSKARANANSSNKQMLPGSGGLANGFGAMKHKNDKSDKSSHSRGFAPYHRRSGNIASTSHNSESLLISSDMDFPLPRTQLTAGAKGIPHLRNTGGVAMAMAPDSPHSNAPSPLMSSQSQPSGVGQNCDPMMPTLSPHPPSKNDIKEMGGGNELNSSGGSQSLADATPLVNVSSMMSNAVDTKCAVSVGMSQAVGGMGGGGLGSGVGGNDVKGAFVMPSSSSHRMDQMKAESVQTWLDTLRQTRAPVLKRPTLPVMFDREDEEELPTVSFYDYPTDSILELTGKWLRPGVPICPGDLDSPGMTSPTPFPASVGSVGGGGHTPIGSSTLPAPGSCGGGSGGSSARLGSRTGRDRSPLRSGGGPSSAADDPYMFSDDQDDSAGAVSSIRDRPMRLSREDVFQRSAASVFGGSRQDDGHRRDFDGNDERRSSLDLSPSPTSKGGGGGGVQTTNLTREYDLIPHIQDLDKLFDTDEECDDPDSPPSTVHLDKPRDDSLTQLRQSCPMGGGGPGGMGGGVMFGGQGHYQGPTPPELSRMFPTPPSTENPFSVPSPMQGIEFTSTDTLTVFDTLHHHHHTTSGGGGNGTVVKEELATHSNVLTALAVRKDCPYVYKVPPASVFPSSKDYDTIELPSFASNPPMNSADLVYRPYQQGLQLQQQLQQLQQIQQQQERQLQAIHSGHYASHQSIESPWAPGAGGSGAYMVGGGSRMRPDSSPAMMHSGGPLSVPGPGGSGGQRMPHTPMSYELMSPASNASSYINRNLSSMDANTQSTGESSHIPEVSSLVVNIALSDSVLNLFKDHNFDSCTLCVCNMNIDGSDVGLYIPEGKSAEDQFRCNCAFSAVVNRKYGVNSGLFYEDEIDIMGMPHGRFDNVKPSLVDRSLPSSTTTLGTSDGMNGSGVGPRTLRDSLGPDLTPDILMLLKDQFSTLYPSASMWMNYRAHIDSPRNASTEWSTAMEMRDGRDACYVALEFSRQTTMDACNQTRIDENSQCLHKWAYLQNPTRLSSSSADVVRLLRSLQPLLQDAIQKKRSTKLWESVYTISGPLTWKDFHLMAGRGSEETSEPKPVPPLLVGYEKDWMSLSPHAIRHWDKLLLEPYGMSRNVTYVVVAPENDFILSQSSLFFKELSVMYEHCHLGTHRPLSNDKLPSGVMRIGRTAAAAMTANEPTDEWFRDIGNSPTAVKLRLYANICRKTLASILTQTLKDCKQQYEDAAEAAKACAYSRLQQPSKLAAAGTSQLMTSSQSTSQIICAANDSQSTMSSLFGSDRESGMIDTASNSQMHSGGGTKDTNGAAGGPESLDTDHVDSGPGSSLGGAVNGEFGRDGPFIVLYMIDPFTYGHDGSAPSEVGSGGVGGVASGQGGGASARSRLAIIGLLRCYHDMLTAVPAELRSFIQLQIVPQQALLDFQEPLNSVQFLKNLSFSVYAHCTRALNHTIAARSLTGFGPAASLERLLKERAGTGIPLYTPPFILAPSRDSELLSLDTGDMSTERSGVIFCAYCLSEDQRYLLASCADATGEIMETVCINIDVPNRQKRRKVEVRRVALQKLWQFLLTVMSGTTLPWRIVIGRFGRLGHGELKGWSAILSRKNLARSSRQMREMCSVCSVLPSSYQVPCVLSACLISTELHPSVHIMSDSIKREENQSGRIAMSTPRDASCTHILVFPTSATAQANLHENVHENHMEDPDVFLDIDPTEEDKDGLNIFLSDLDLPDLTSPASPKNHSAPTSPSQAHEDGGGHTGGGGGHRGGRGSCVIGEQEESTTQQSLQNQPLAMGFYVSTASPGPLPKWFWSSCPHREKTCPVCFKAALHIHCPLVQQNQNQDDLMHQNVNTKHSHPLDSSLTCDVLRYVLETYNQLSWLTVDPLTNDRRSCLPAHILVLMQLYHGFNTYV